MKAKLHKSFSSYLQHIQTLKQALHPIIWVIDALFSTQTINTLAITSSATILSKLSNECSGQIFSFMYRSVYLNRAIAEIV